MDLRQKVTADSLTSFAVFAKYLNFTRAAEELRVSQPALHTKVRKLAEMLGRPLYRRTGRRLILTREGELVARYAREWEERMTSLVAEVHGTAPARPLVLAAGEGAYLYLLGDVIGAALTGPAPRLRLINGDRSTTLSAVRTGRADLGVGVFEVLPDDLHTTLLASYPQVLVMPAGHRLSKAPRLTVADLAGAALVVPPPARPHRVVLERALLAARVPWTVAVEAEGWPLTLHFVALGVGLAVVNGCVWPTPGLVTREITDLPAVPYQAIQLPGASGHPWTRDLLTDIRTHLRPANRPLSAAPTDTSVGERQRSGETEVGRVRDS